MSYRDAQYPGQEDSGSEQYWTTEDFIENDRSYEVVRKLEAARKEYSFLTALDSSEKYQAELKDYAGRCGVTVEQLLSYHRTGELTQ